MYEQYIGDVWNDVIVRSDGAKPASQFQMRWSWKDKLNKVFSVVLVVLLLYFKRRHVIDAINFKKM